MGEALRRYINGGDIADAPRLTLRGLKPPAVRARAAKVEPHLQAMVEAGLTQKQAQVFHYLFSRAMESGCQPTIREVNRHFGWTSFNSCPGFIRSLQKKGWLVRVGRNTTRSIRFLRRPDGGKFLGFVARLE